MNKMKPFMINTLLGIYPIVVYFLSGTIFRMANISMYEQQNNMWWLFSLPHMINVLCILGLHALLRNRKKTKSILIITILYIVLLGCPIWSLILNNFHLPNIFSFLLNQINFDSMSVILESFVFYCTVLVSILFK